MKMSLPINSGPQQHYVLQAARRAPRPLGGGRRAAAGGAASRARGRGRGPLALDALGIAKGGLRSPWVDAPTRRALGSRPERDRVRLPVRHHAAPRRGRLRAPLSARGAGLPGALPGGDRRGARPAASCSRRTPRRSGRSPRRQPGERADDPRPRKEPSHERAAHAYPRRHSLRRVRAPRPLRPARDVRQPRPRAAHRRPWRRRRGPVASAQGPETVARYDFASAPQLDLLLLPGGIGTLAQLENVALHEFLRARSRRRGGDAVGLLGLGDPREGRPPRRPPRHLEQAVLRPRDAARARRSPGWRRRAGSRTGPSSPPRASRRASTWRSP